MSQQPLFKLVGSPLTLPTIVGYHNLTSLQKEELNWEEDDFADPKAQPFWYFDGSLCFEEQDLQPVRQYFHLLSNSEWNYFLPPCYAVKFNRDNRGLPTSVIIQEVEALTLVLPEVLTQEQAGQLVEKLACHVYETAHWDDPQFNPEPETVSTVVRDLVRYSDIQDREFDSFREEPFAEILTTLFEQCRVTSDIVGLMSEFFDTHLGRTL